jgi:hypothetical protein
MGITSYAPEMGEAKPQAQMEVSYCYGGGHWIDTPLTLKTGRSIRFEKTYTEKELIKGSYKVGWNLYYVTNNGLEMLEAQYSISREALLD